MASAGQDGALRSAELRNKEAFRSLQDTARSSLSLAKHEAVGAVSGFVWKTQRHGKKHIEGCLASAHALHF